MADYTFCRVKELSLNNFRNYESFVFSPSSDVIVITGHNGAGKTNILEAISLLTPGRGIRNSKLDEMNAKFSHYNWNVDSLIEGEYGQHVISMRKLDDNNQKRQSKRYIKIDDREVKVQSELSKLLSISWLLPQMDQVFIEGAGTRRKLLDKIVSTFEPGYLSCLAKYEHYMRERHSLLKEGGYDNHWIKIIERSMAENAVVVANHRVRMIEILQNVVDGLDYGLSNAVLHISGELEEKVNNVSSLQLEEEFCAKLESNREEDRCSGRTNAGVHRSDLIVYNKAKNINANMCSVGEQKFLLLSLFFAEVFAYMKWKQRVPIILLDDIISHLDGIRRTMLYEMISAIGAQCWITGTDKEMFNFVGREVQFIEIKNNQLEVI